MAEMVEITCACGCGKKREVRLADVRRGWGLFYDKSCKAKGAGIPTYDGEELVRHYLVKGGYHFDSRTQFISYWRELHKIGKIEFISISQARWKGEHFKDIVFRVKSDMTCIFRKKGTKERTKKQFKVGKRNGVLLFTTEAPQNKDLLEWVKKQIK